MRVDLENRERLSARVGAEDRDRHGVIAADADRNDATLEDGRHGSGDAAAVFWPIGEITRHIAGIDHGGQVHRRIRVEVPVIDEGREPGRTATDGRRCFRAAYGRPRSRIRPAERDAQDRDLRIDPRKVRLDWHSEEA